MTIMYLYYNQPRAIDVLKQMDAENYGCNLLFVDDASKEPLKLGWKNTKVIRIEEDIPWNMPRANNIGIKSLDPNERILRMDMDHFITKEQVETLKAYDLRPNEVMKFKRSNARDYPPNIYFTYVRNILYAGLYNEVFCGNYGYEDRDLMDRLAKKCIFTQSEISLYVDMDLKTRGLDRDTSINLKKYKTLWKGMNQ